MSEIPVAPVKRLISKSGGNRVSEAAAEELRDAMEEYGREKAQRAGEMAEHAGRKTVKADDVKMAV